jgi:hypothetical protein
MPDNRFGGGTSFNPQEFGKVLARLDAQDRELHDIKQDMREMKDAMNKLMRVVSADPREKKVKRDWMEILASALFGAVAYFVAAKIIG